MPECALCYHDQTEHNTPALGGCQAHHPETGVLGWTTTPAFGAEFLCAAGPPCGCPAYEPDEQK